MGKNGRVTLAILKVDMEYIKKHLEEDKEWKKGLPKKYAKKWVEKVIGGGIGLILIAVIGAGLKLII